MKRILFIQNGDYRDAYWRFAEGGEETYRDQRRSVDYVANLAPEAYVCTASFADENYRTELAPNLWAIGMKRDGVRTGLIREIYDQEAPTHVVLRRPHLGFLKEARRRNLPICPNFADIFEAGGPRTTWRNFRLRRELRLARAPCVSNHSLNASRSLVKTLGLPAARIVPWDWSKIPVAEPPKSGLADPAAPTAFFAGNMTVPKGVGDCLEAVSVLKDAGITLRMRFAGPGNLDHWGARAKTLGIADQIEFLGMIPNSAVRERMRAHDFVIVPSRHSYPEGLPNTIYEALASRSVLVMSDHPAFMGRLEEDEQALVFKASDPGSLAEKMKMVITTPELYARLSANAGAAHDALYVGMEFTELVDAFLSDPANETGWVARNSLESL